MKPATAVELGEWLAGPAAQCSVAPLRDQAANHLLDTLGAMVAGQGEPVSRIARDVHDRAGSVPLLGTAEAREPRDAAFANAVAAHALEIDDTEGCDHSGAVAVPVLWSLCHRADPVPSERVLPALIAGYEIGRRVQLALGGYDRFNARGWHSTAVCGVFAAAAASAVMLGLDSGRAASALGLAASSAAGTWAFAADGAMSKQLHPGNAARAGLEAALLADRGAAGPVHVFDDVWGGMLRTYGADPSDAAHLTSDLGSTWHFQHSAIKPYAVCRSAHSSIDALARILEENGTAPADVSEVRLHVSDFLRPMICPPSPRDAAQARMSLPIATALFLGGAALMPHDFDSFADARIQALRERVVVVPDEQNGTEPLVEVRVGRRIHRLRATSARGGQEDPLSRAEVRAKFVRLTIPVIGSHRADELERWVLSMVDDATPTLPERKVADARC